MSISQLDGPMSSTLPMTRSPWIGYVAATQRYDVDEVRFHHFYAQLRGVDLALMGIGAAPRFHPPAVQ